jgi:beta-glucosidase
LFPAGYGLNYNKPSSIGPVNEDPRVDLVASASEDTYLTRGAVSSPWRVGLDNVVTSRAVDLAAQEDARQFSWTGAGSMVIDGPPVNIMRQLDGGFALLLDWRVDSMTSDPVTLSFAGGALDVSGILRGAAQGTRLETRIPLRCFQSAGADLKSVSAPLRITATKGFAVTLRGAKLEPQGATPPCPPKL